MAELTAMKNIEIFGAAARGYGQQAGALSDQADKFIKAGSPSAAGELDAAPDLIGALQAARQSAGGQLKLAGQGMGAWAGATERLQTLHLEARRDAAKKLGDVINASGDTASPGA